MTQPTPPVEDCVSRSTHDGIEFVTILTGHLGMPPRAEWFVPDTPPGTTEWPADVLACITLVARTPAEEVIVVDPSTFDARTIEKAAAWNLHAEATCDLEDALAHVDLTPDDVTHVLITHGHADHFSGTSDGARVRFPRAQHFIPELDWNAENDPTNEEMREVLEPVDAAGLLQQVSGDMSIAADVAYISAPGESAGHHVVQIGPVWYLGDLVHFVAEIEHPDWGPVHVPKDVAERSRRDVFERAVGGHVIFTHNEFPGWGTVHAEGDGWRYAHALSQTL